MKKFNLKKWIVENKYGKQPNYSNYTQPVNEQLVGAAAGFVAMVAAAGGLAALQMKMENPEEREKNPKLAMFLDILDELGSAASSSKAGGTTSGGVNEQEGKEVDLSKIENELGDIFDAATCELPDNTETQDTE